MNLRFKNTLLFLAAIICGSFFWFSVRAASVDQSININVTVPGGGGGGGEAPPPAVDAAPSISSVQSSVSFTTATVTWSASDDKGIASASFVYGLTNNYGSSAVVVGTYGVNLSGLSAGTLYHFKISVTDTGAHTTEYTGTFTASSVPGDITAPTITNVIVSVGVTTATIKWDTNELSDSQINYGRTNAYGSNYFDSAGALLHSASLSGLAPNTIYHFQIIATDSAGNSSSTVDRTFTTGIDNVSPPDVTGFNLATTTDSIVLSWSNPSLVGTPDFSLVKVVRKVGGASGNPGDGVVVYTGSGEGFTDNNVLIGIEYFYTIFSFDTSNNHSPGIFRKGKLILAAPPAQPEICGNNLDDDNNGKIDCADNVCHNLPECNLLPPTSTPPVPESEICNNGIDDDLNGKKDCADNACVGYGGCVPAVFKCSNMVDDDGDGKIDFPNDPGCESENDNDEYNPPEPTTPEFARISLNDLQFLAGNRRLRLDISGEDVIGLSGANFTVAVPEKILVSAPLSMTLKVGDTDQHQFVYNREDKMYYADLSFSGIGAAQAYLEIDYGSGQFDSVGFKLNSLPWGQVVDNNGQALEGVIITIYGQDGISLPMDDYGQLNPIRVGSNGDYGWVVPNGDFRVTLSKDGYYDRSVTISGINNHIVNTKLVLIPKPPKFDLNIDPKASFTKNARNVVQALGKQTKILSTIAVQKIQDAANDPQVEKVNEQVVAPTTITVVVAGAVPLVPWFDFLPFLRLVFLQPLMLLGWRKREKWGMVYNSLNKMPIDLATVRLINLETNRVVQSKVTDTKGRFMFMVDPGKYGIEIQKNAFTFPSSLLAGYKSDGKKVDIYHGEPIEVTKPTSITPSIPLDPSGAQKKPARLVLEKLGRRVQNILSLSGIVVTAVSLYISPKWYVAGLLVAHISFFFIFRRLAVPPKAKNWGIVSDVANKAPVGRVIARLFNAQFNKLVDTQITDSSGKYYFMGGDAKYYVTYEHKAYHPQKTDIINLEGKDADVITMDVGLNKH